MGDEGHFYEIRYRLRRQLSHHHWTLGKPFTPSQEEAWLLLNEVEKIIKILALLERSLGPNDKSELAYQVRHTLVMHQPAWKEVPHVQPGSVQVTEGDRQRKGEEGPRQDAARPAPQPPDSTHGLDGHCPPGRG